MENKFSFFIPIEIEKSGKSGEERYANMRFKGVASNPNKGDDKQGQWLDPSGFDYKDLLLSGGINWHHLWKDKPSAIIGEPIKASITKSNEFYIEGRLYKDSKLAREVYDLAEMLEKNSDTRRLGFSIEGIPLEKDPFNENRITKARISNVAITPSPVCPGTKMELMKGGLDKMQFEKQSGSEFVIDIIDNGIRYTVDSHLNIEKAMCTGSGPGGAEYIEKDVKKAMMAGETTGRDTTNKTSTQETLKEEDVEGSKKKKKKKDDEKEFFTKGEIHIRNFSRFNLDADSSKSFYTIAEKIQRQLTPNMEVTKISKEAIEKAEQLLGLGQPVAATTESAEEIAKKTAELQKAQENKALQKELEETLEKAEKLKLKIEGKPEAATTITASSATTVTAPISNPEFEKAVNDKIGALGILIQAKGEENIELKKAVDNLLKFNEILGKKIGIIESQPLDRKSVSTSAYIEKAGEQTAPGANGVKTYSMSNKKHRAAVADVLFKASLNPDGTGVKDEEFAKACSYIELGSFPNQSQASRIQARLLEECKIKLVQ